MFDVTSKECVDARCILLKFSLNSLTVWSEQATSSCVVKTTRKLWRRPITSALQKRHKKPDRKTCRKFWTGPRPKRHVCVKTTRSRRDDLLRFRTVVVFSDDNIQYVNTVSDLYALYANRIRTTYALRWWHATSRLDYMRRHVVTRALYQFIC